MIIVPKGYDYAKYQGEFVGTGHLQDARATHRTSGATFVRNPYYWGKAAIPSEIQWTFYSAEDADGGGSRGRRRSTVLDQFSVSTSPQLLDGKYNLAKLQGFPCTVSSRCGRDFEALHEQIRPPGDRLVRSTGLELVAVPLQGLRRCRQRQPVCSRASPRRSDRHRGSRNAARTSGWPSSCSPRAEYARGFKAPLVTESHEEMARARPDRQGLGWQDRASTSTSRSRTPNKYYGSARVRELRLARRRDEPGRLRRSLGRRTCSSRRRCRPTTRRLARVPGTPLVSTTPSLRQACRASTSQLSDLTSQRTARQGDRDACCSTRRRSSIPTSTTTSRRTQKNVSGVYPTPISQFFLWNVTKS